MSDKQSHSSHTSKLQQWLENIWYNKGAGKWLLLPLTGLYCALNAIKRWNDTRNLPLLPCPVIVVGNITVGGTGKTPLVIYIVKLLQKQGYKPAIITRGYGGKASSWPQEVTSKSDANMVGDEAVLMASRTLVPVYAGADRVSSINTLLQRHDCNVIVSDDGLQHYKLPRDIRITVIDGKRQLGNEICLPAGPLRERKQRLNNCDLIVMNGASDDADQSSNQSSNQWLSMKIEGNTLINLKTNKEKSLEDFSGKKVHAITGIGNPQRFYQTLQNAGVELVTHDYPDHHGFTQSDLQFNDDLPIIMTEKDAVKCKNFASERVWFLPVLSVMDDRFDKMFLQRVEPLMDMEYAQKP